MDLQYLTMPKRPIFDMNCGIGHAELLPLIDSMVQADIDAPLITMDNCVRAFMWMMSFITLARWERWLTACYLRVVLD